MGLFAQWETTLSIGLALLLSVSFSLTSSIALMKNDSEQEHFFTMSFTEESSETSSWKMMEPLKMLANGSALDMTIDFTGRIFNQTDSNNITAEHVSIPFILDVAKVNSTVEESEVPYEESNIDIPEGKATIDDSSCRHAGDDSLCLAISTVNLLNLPENMPLPETNTAATKSNIISLSSNWYNNATAVTSFSISTSAPPVTEEQPLVSYTTRITISWYYALVVNPVIGLVGLVTNAISAIVIIRSGLQKPSNIFLLSLAISDWICMFKNLDVAWLLSYQRQKMSLRYTGWEMPYWPSLVCYVLDKITVRVSNFAAGMSASVTVLITLERFVATYFPLQFTNILTPRRAWIVLMSTIVCVLPPYLFKVFHNDFAYFFYPEFNASMGMFVDSKIYNNSRPAMRIFELYFVTHFEFTLPLAIVITGCVLISIKIAIVRRKRQALVPGISKRIRGNMRTTKTLLMVCLLFSVTRMAYLFVYLPIFDDTKRRTRSVSYIFVDVRWSLIQVNSACNIVVYVLFNPKFKRILKNLFMSKNFRRLGVLS